MSNRSLQQQLDDPWRPSRRWWRSQLEAEQRCWLLDPSSLTQRIQAVCSGRFRVQVEYQGWARPQLSEWHALGLRRRQLALIREVHLLCDEIPWVFARTVIPRRTLRGRERRLGMLGDRPLGAVLFADPRMQRGIVEIARLEAGNPLYQHALQGVVQTPEAIWGRRSVFSLGHKKLLVSEIFLPDVGRCRNGN